MVSEELAIFERRLANWEDTHRRLWTYGGDAATFISRQADRIVDAQLKAADRIVVSQERIKSGIDKVALGVERVYEGLASLRAAFEWGFSELIWQLEQERSILKEILEVLQAPLDTQAKELRKRAVDAYRNGWFDDALEDFLEAEEKNKYDFAIHISLGHIYFFEKKSPEKALEYYEKAVKYAIPKSHYHASYALLHIGLIKYLQADFQKAYEATSKALELSPNLYEIHFQHAQYCADLGKYDEAIEHLKEAIAGDRYYCVKAEAEKDFDVMKEQLRSFFEELRDKAQSRAKIEIEKVEELVKDAESYGVESDKLRSAINELDEAKKFIERGSLFDCLDAISKAYKAHGSASDSLIGYLSEIRRKIENRKSEIKEEIEKLKEKHAEKMAGVSIILIHIFLGYLLYVANLDVLVLCFLLTLPFGWVFLIIVFLVLPSPLCRRKGKALLNQVKAEEDKLNRCFSEAKSKSRELGIEEKMKKKGEILRSMIFEK